ncbi:hypothetical protein XELAEV_18006017mg [Xenopus laevis]|uniref:Uncharacterized protein n=1 Tax=Xenopus laevis TaxID=8355 RepID=A0A974I3Q2_XENLA|nr:hypothetical protein XELAEV_18006017mg [Xenopus laevis]
MPHTSNPGNLSCSPYHVILTTLRLLNTGPSKDLFTPDMFANSLLLSQTAVFFILCPLNSAVAMAAKLSSFAMTFRSFFLCCKHSIAFSALTTSS